MGSKYADFGRETQGLAVDGRVVDNDMSNGSSPEENRGWQLAYDRDHKGPLYAAAGLQEYWLVNIPERVVEVYRQPVPDAASFSGWRYQECQTLRAEDQVSPLAAPEVVVPVDSLFL